MKKYSLILFGFLMLLAILFFACDDPLTDVSAGPSRARVAQMPIVDLSLLPEEFVFYANQPIGMLDLPLDCIDVSVGTLSFQWLVSDFVNGAGARAVDNTYGGGNTNTLFLTLEGNEGKIKYYALRITNTQPVPNANYAPAVFTTHFVKVTIKPAFHRSRINSVNASGVPFTTTSDEVIVTFDVSLGLDPVPNVQKANIAIHGSAMLGDGDISWNGDRSQLTIPITDVTRGRILLVIKGVDGIEESFYPASLFDNTPLSYTAAAYQELIGPDKTDVGSNRIRLEFNLPVDLTHPEILLSGGLIHAIPAVPLVRNSRGKVWTVIVDAQATAEAGGNFLPTITLEGTVGVAGEFANPRGITGAQERPVRIEW